MRSMRALGLPDFWAVPQTTCGLGQQKSRDVKQMVDIITLASQRVQCCGQRVSVSVRMYIYILYNMCRHVHPISQ